MTPTSHPKHPHKTTDPKAQPKAESAPRTDPIQVVEPQKDTSPQPGTEAATSPSPEPTPKAEEPAAVAAPVSAAPQEPVVYESPKRSDEGEAKKPFTIQVPVATMKLLGVISRAEGKPISEIILQALAQADFRVRARKALEALAREIE